MKSVITLAKLLAPWFEMQDTPHAGLEINQLVLDSRKLEVGDTFVAIDGHAVDGRRFIDSAAQSGANCTIAQASDAHPHGSWQSVGTMPVIYIEDLPNTLSAMAQRLYPVEHSRLIGVTGTNGKTTITQLIAQWLELLGNKTAVMGTTGNGFLSDLRPAENTTGSAIDIQRELSQLDQAGAKITALEVSSHGLVQGRVKALPFAVGVFSNLSRDHLDYHHTMAEYANAKLTLFTKHDCQHAVINVDDEVGYAWMDHLQQALAVSLKPVAEFERAIWANHVTYSEQGITIDFDGLYGQGQLNVPLIGEFNASNTMLAFAALLSLGFDKQNLIEQANPLCSVIGRMELFQADGKAKVVVDYAHTPDALEKALRALQVHCQGKLWVIFGCGGDRDTGKRPLMGAIAEKLADTVIIADDNPRSEDPDTIVTDILRGVNNPQRVLIEHSRFAALEQAIQSAQVDDIILLAGKGHEDYQVMSEGTIHYSDRESAASLLGIEL